MIRLRRFLPIAVLAAASLFAGCQYFSNVVIPATDTVAPLSVAAVYDLEQNKYVEMDFAPGMNFIVTDPSETFLAVGATYDNGGAQGVTLEGYWTNFCRGEAGVLPNPHFFHVPQEIAKQTGHVGDTVSNGVWTYYPIRFDQDPIGCSHGPGALDHATFQWTVTSVDFHDNVSTTSGLMTYTP